MQNCVDFVLERLISSSWDHTMFLCSFYSCSVYILAAVTNQTATEAILQVIKLFPAGFVCKKKKKQLFQETWTMKAFVALSASIISAGWGAGGVAVIISANVAEADCWVKSCFSLIQLLRHSWSLSKLASEPSRSTSPLRSFLHTCGGVPPSTGFFFCTFKQLVVICFG